jgi:NAD(P)-dependent dehydrogenase (short-subunit alcohol dehydrogenase family)
MTVIPASNKVAIITAAGKGMGAACARVLHKNGYRLGLLSPSGSAEALARELGGVGVTGSVTNPDDLKKLVDRTMETFGRIDAVVNNTGHPPKGDLLEISDADWHMGLDMLVMNVIRVSRLVVPIMQRQGGGSIVNISTAAAVEPNLKFPVSSALRAGLAAFSKLFAERYAKDNIRMNNVLPGMIDTFPVMPEFIAKIPMERYGTADELARVVGFLISDHSAYMTGQSLRVDGGLTRSI